jgi:protein SCO1
MWLTVFQGLASSIDGGSSLSIPFSVRHAGIGLLATLLVAVVVLAAACGSDSGGANASPPPTAAGQTGDGWEGAIVTPPIPKPDVTLTDTAGMPFNVKKDTQGYVTLVYVGYLHCPDICPQHMSDLREAFRQLPADVTSHIKVVFTTADPDRDTPALIRKWLDVFSKDFIGLYGTQAQVDAYQTALGIKPAAKEDLGGGNYSVSHAAFVIAYGTDNLAHLVYPSGITPETWVHDLPKLVKEGWKE